MAPRTRLHVASSGQGAGCPFVRFNTKLARRPATSATLGHALLSAGPASYNGTTYVDSARGPRPHAGSEREAYVAGRVTR